MPNRIYLDHAATTPLRPEAEAAMREGFALWANPSSPHAEGRKARAALEDARERIKQALGWDEELIFTSGASEAALLAFDHAVVIDEVASSVEHDSIHAFELFRGTQLVPVGPDGAVDLQALAEVTVPFREADDAEEDTALAAIQHVNSETGNRQDIGMAAEIVHGNDGLLLVDCSQSAGKFALPKLADLAIVSAHKLGGPVGIGALLVKDFAMLKPSGGQERGYRRGTENLPAILGFAAAMDACAEPYVAAEVLEPFDRLADEVRALGGGWLSDRLASPTPYIRALSMPGMSGSAQLMRFDMQGIAVSQGSACSSGSLRTSHVLEAMGIDADEASRTIRVSVGWNTTRQEVERFAETWIAIAREAAEKAA